MIKTFKIENKLFQFNESDEFFAGLFSIGYPSLSDKKIKLKLIDNFNIMDYLICENFDTNTFNLMDKKDFEYFIVISSNLYGFYSQDFINGFYKYIDIYFELFHEKMDTSKYIQMFPFDKDGNFFEIENVKFPYDVKNIEIKVKYRNMINSEFRSYFRNLGFDDPEVSPISSYGNASML